jgi:hypothetical protein
MLQQMRQSYQTFKAEAERIAAAEGLTAAAWFRRAAMRDIARASNVMAL